MTTVTRVNVWIACARCGLPVELVLGLPVGDGRARFWAQADPWADHVNARPACDGAGITMPYRVPATAWEYGLIRAVVRAFEEGG